MSQHKKPATLNHTISTKASLLEFERWFKKEFGKRPGRDSLFWEGERYKHLLRGAKRAWLAREKVY